MGFIMRRGGRMPDVGEVRVGGTGMGGGGRSKEKRNAGCMGMGRDRGLELNREMQLGHRKQQQPSPSLQSSMLPVMLPVRHWLCCNSRCWQLAAPDAVLITVGRQGIAAAAAAAG